MANKQLSIISLLGTSSLVLIFLLSSVTVEETSKRLVVEDQSVAKLNEKVQLN
jgi:hypothetical protein